MQAGAHAHPTTPTRKRVLVPLYSQSGQLGAVVEQILAPLRESGDIEVHVEPLQPRPAYPFPWGVLRFFDTFPEAALMQPQPLAPLGLRGDEAFDLVILPYQVWFLAPSLPVTSLLRLPLARQLLAGRPVVTVVVCRNMWLMAQEKMKGLLADVGARLIDHVALTDRGPLAATFITTPLWMFTGRRTGWFGLPPAGVPEADIRAARRFGLALRDALKRDAERGTVPLLAGLGAATADPTLLSSERAGTRSFFIWGRLIRRLGPPGALARQPVVALYVVFLVALILTVVPLSAVVQFLLRPWLNTRLERLKTAFEAPSGSGTERIAQYES
ncbi:dialkylrecorsinol condensing protein DarA [Sphaerotilus microaerophilus]|uniref:Dialkylrecorsinol condensing protein DarA n=1 Tax=Sphaerotilus microaerophilus TaxID=2914710 RepID=A0ABN6PWC4_9BURK|nr:dialkylrecorsinol condensing protein DarA [Sphaerotilus sp. FB-5]